MNILLNSNTYTFYTRAKIPASYTPKLWNSFRTTKKSFSNFNFIQWNAISKKAMEKMHNAINSIYINNGPYPKVCAIYFLQHYIWFTEFMHNTYNTKNLMNLKLYTTSLCLLTMISRVYRCILNIGEHWPINEIFLTFFDGVTRCAMFVLSIMTSSFTNNNVSSEKAINENHLKF